MSGYIDKDGNVEFMLPSDPEEFEAFAVTDEGKRTIEMIFRLGQEHYDSLPWYRKLILRLRYGKPTHVE